MACEIVPATKEDIPNILALIQELAIFEREPDAVVVTEQILLRDGFGPAPLFYTLMARAQGKVVGMSFCYIRYSTWKGPRLYLEDLIVTENARGNGYGTLLFNATKILATDLGCSAICWQVLEWNQPAIDFYTAKGAVQNLGWLDMVMILTKSVRNDIA